MLSLSLREASLACIHSCRSTPFAEPINPKPKHNTATTTTTTTASSLLPEAHFTNHESLPPLSDAFSNFIATHPHYADTELADRIRDRDYPQLSNHICLDYAGFSLFSHAQLLSPVPSSRSQPLFFNIDYKSASLKSQVRYGNQDTALESAIRKRIMGFLKISDKEYCMVCTANRTSAFKILAESYPFHSNKRLLTVYDYESEAVRMMAESAQKKGARVTSAEFSWPSMRIHSEKLKKVMIKRKKKMGLFVFPPQSRMTGARYPYLWMSLAQENGWHVVLDACSLGPKDMDTLGLSLIKPDFIVCSFFKVFGENPSGFAGLFIKRSSIAILESSTAARSIGIVTIIPARRISNQPDDTTNTNLETRPSNAVEITGSSSGPRQAQIKQGQTAEKHELMIGEAEEETGEPSSKIVRSGKPGTSMEVECRGLDHADSLGLLLISSRLSYLTNWLVNALMKLKHPRSEDRQPLVRIYGPQIKFDRGPAVAFNVFDWKGEKVEPALIQKLADRSNIALSCGFLCNIWFSDKFEEEKDAVLERRICEITTAAGRKKKKIDLGITVVNASLSFLNNFEDAYRLWSFVAKFLDADFIEKERWRYIALNQKVVEV